jgi:hypothetical protein
VFIGVHLWFQSSLLVAAKAAPGSSATQFFSSLLIE